MPVFSARRLKPGASGLACLCLPPFFSLMGQRGFFGRPGRRRQGRAVCVHLDPCRRERAAYADIREEKGGIFWRLAALQIALRSLARLQTVLRRRTMIYLIPCESPRVTSMSQCSRNAAFTGILRDLSIRVYPPMSVVD